MFIDFQENYDAIAVANKNNDHVYDYDDDDFNDYLCIQMCQNKFVYFLHIFSLLWPGLVWSGNK